EPREIAARARPAVVLVHAKQGGERVGQGSGFIVSADGRLITNRHLIAGAAALEVQLASGEIYDNVSERRRPARSGGGLRPISSWMTDRPSPSRSVRRLLPPADSSPPYRWECRHQR